MAKVSFKRIEDSALIDNYPIVDGSYYITKDGKSYADYDDLRVPIGGTPDSAMSDRSTNSVQNKVVKEYVDDVKSDVATLQYDLITNGQEVKTGYKIDGKDVYAKRFTISSLSSGTEIAHGLTDFELIDCKAITYYQGVWRSLNYPLPNGYYAINVDATNIVYYSSVSLPGGTGKVTLYYIHTN